MVGHSSRSLRIERADRVFHVPSEQTKSVSESEEIVLENENPDHDFLIQALLVRHSSLLL